MTADIANTKTKHAKNHSREKYFPAVVSAFAGISVTLSLAPFSLWPLGLVALALLHRVLSTATPKSAAWLGWCFGAGLFLSGTSWLYVSIHDYGDASLLLAGILSGGFCLLLALMHAIFGYGYVRWIRDTACGRWLGFAAWWVIWEWIRYWLLTGFPWLYVGYAHLTTPLSGWAPVGGIYSIGFIVALSGAAFAIFFSDFRASTFFSEFRIAAFFSEFRVTKLRAALPLVVGVALWCGGFSLSKINWTTPLHQRASIALVQANIPQSVKWQPDALRDTLQLYRDLSAPYWRDADIVIWPEAAIPAFYDAVKPFFDVEAELATQRRHALISGVPFRLPANDELPEGGIYNSAVALGNGEGVYHKQHLVPFGEYVPLEKYLRGLIQFFDLPMSDFQAGPSHQPPLRASGLTFAPYICYEVVYGDLVRHARADVLLTLSNDAWFGHSIGPLQHLQMAQMRALELGRYMVRATGNGVTAIIDEKGRITARAPQFERTVLTGSIEGFSGLTPYARFGSWPILSLCGIIVALCCWRRAKP